MRSIALFIVLFAATGVGNGLGGRAAVAQIAGYTDLLYTSGDASTWLLSAGTPTGDRGDDLGLLNGWLALGGRDLLMTGDNLANSISWYPFLGSVLGVAFGDGSVRDEIGGQATPVVVATEGNPVFPATVSWLAYGGCPSPNGFDSVTALPGAVRLAQFTAADGVSTPYPYAAAVLYVSGTNRTISLSHDLMFIMSWDKNPAWASTRGGVLRNVLTYFGVTEATDPSGVPGVGAPAFAVTASPNPFNPAITLRYTLVRPGPVTMKVYDTRGALVRTLLDGPVPQTAGVVIWDGKDQRGDGASSGLYFVETRADGQVDVRKVMMLK